TVANPKGELKAITTQSGLVLDEPSVPIPHPFINLEEDEREEEILTDQDNFDYSIEPHQESINMIDVYNVSHEEYRENLFAINHPSGIPTPISEPETKSSSSPHLLPSKKVI
ncbi:hypothetical protein Tco_0234883, partial [Tanacetum coccineum]